VFVKDNKKASKSQRTFSKQPNKLFFIAKDHLYKRGAEIGLKSKKHIVEYHDGIF
jgi:hypothetical protein